MTLAAEVPVSVSLPEPPVTFSKPEIVSPAASPPEAVLLAMSTVTPVESPA